MRLVGLLGALHEGVGGLAFINTTRVDDYTRIVHTSVLHPQYYLFLQIQYATALLVPSVVL